MAGHETTGHTLTFTLAYLALYPEWQEAIHKEITDVCGDTAYPSELPPAVNVTDAQTTKTSTPSA